MRLVYRTAHDSVALGAVDSVQFVLKLLNLAGVSINEDPLLSIADVLIQFLPHFIHTFQSIATLIYLMLVHLLFKQIYLE